MKVKIVKLWFSNHMYVFAVLQCCKCQCLHPDRDTLWIGAASWIIKSSAAIFRRTLTIIRRQLETVEISSLVKDSVIVDVTDFSRRILMFRGWSLSNRGPKFTFPSSRPPRHSTYDCWTINCCLAWLKHRIGDWLLFYFEILVIIINIHLVWLCTSCFCIFPPPDKVAPTTSTCSLLPFFASLSCYWYPSQG